MIAASIILSVYRPQIGGGGGGKYSSYSSPSHYDHVVLSEINYHNDHSITSPFYV